MGHCFKTSHLLKIPMKLISRCGTLDWNLVHRSNQLPCVPAFSVPSRSCCVMPAAAAVAPSPAAGMGCSWQLLGGCVELLTRQLRALEEVHRLQQGLQWTPGLTAALSPLELQAFRVATAAAVDTQQSAAAQQRTSAAPPTAERTAPTPANNRPTPDQLKAVEDNLITNLENLFCRSMDYSIYDPDLVFDNRIRGVRTVGVRAYVRQCALLRIVGGIKFTYVKLEVLQSSTHVEDGTVRLRWRIRGVSALRSFINFWKMRPFNSSAIAKDQGIDWYDGYSIFYVHSDGFVHTHIADNMMPDWGCEPAGSSRLLGLASRLATVYGLGPSPPAIVSLATLIVQLEQLETKLHTVLPVSPNPYQPLAQTLPGI